MGLTGNTVSRTIARFPRLVRAGPPDQLQRVPIRAVIPSHRLTELVFGTDKAVLATDAHVGGAIAGAVIAYGAVGVVAKLGRDGNDNLEKEEREEGEMSRKRAFP